MILALHLPDGFLSLERAALGWLQAALVIAIALRMGVSDRQIPRMGVIAAAVFAAQCIAFPIVGGTSAHLLGAALAAIILGPWAAVLVLTVVVGIEATLLQDGGLLAMGWNLVNMAVFGALLGGVVFSALRNAPGAFVAGFLTAEMGAIAAAQEMGQTIPTSVSLPVMAVSHAVVGLVEGCATAAAFLLLLRARPDAVCANAPGQRLAALIVIACGLVVALL